MPPDLSVNQRYLIFVSHRRWIFAISSTMSTTSPSSPQLLPKLPPLLPRQDCRFLKENDIDKQICTDSERNSNDYLMMKQGALSTCSSYTRAEAEVEVGEEVEQIPFSKKYWEKMFKMTFKDEISSALRESRFLIADCHVMSFVFVCWQINIRNTNQLSWAIN